MRLELRGVSKAYGEHTVLDNVNLSLPDVEALVLVGPSGGGKTTLLRLIAGLERPESGQISIDGRLLEFGNDKAMREYRKGVGMVFQSYNLFPHLTALRNITLPLEKVHGYPVADAARQALSLLERFQLEEHAHKKPMMLSGGQNQRIAICRAVATRPRFLLLDEPTSALDPEYTTEVLDLVGELRREGMRLILVTHEMGFAREAADNMLFIAEQGILAQGPPAELFASTANDKVTRFFSKVLKYKG